MPVEDLKYYQTTEQIIGSAMKVHRHFGAGFQEVIYQRALMVELNQIPLPCSAEVSKEIIYRQRLVGKRRLDLIVENVLVELKAIPFLDARCYSQILNYLRVFEMEVGLLINFGEPSLKFKRFINTQHKKIEFPKPPQK